MASMAFDRGTYLLWMCCFVAIINSTTTGYDSSMMNGLQILPSYSVYFHLTTATTALNVAIVFLGSVIATPFGGTISDKWGRKGGLIITAIIAIVGVVLQTAAVHEAMFCIGRLLIGVSITTGGVAAPAYLSEVAHPDHRERVVSLLGSAYYVGSIIAAGVTYGSQYIDSTWAWRLPSLIQLVPSLLCLAPLPFIPESPRWLIYKDRHEEAMAMIVKYHGNGDPNAPIVAMEYAEICNVIAFEKETQKIQWKALVQGRPNRWRFGIVFCVGMFCQLSGNNIISYYLGTTLTTAGITNVQTQLGINIGLSVFNLFVAVAGGLLASKIGRRPSFLITTAGMAVIMIIYTVLTKFYYNTQTYAASVALVVLIFIFYGLYSFSWTPLGTLYPVEILSYSLRANGMAAYSGFIYIASFFNTYIIPFAMKITWGFYLITAIWVMIECVIMYYYFPETKGMSMEEIEAIFDGEGFRDGFVAKNIEEVTSIRLQVVGEKNTAASKE